MATDVLAVIDGALRDYETGADAMRWVPPDDRAPRPLAVTTPVMLDIRVDVEPFIAAMRQIGAVAERVIGQWSELFRKLVPTVEVIHDARRAHLSAMHREYARRQRTRRRRR